MIYIANIRTQCKQRIVSMGERIKNFSFEVLKSQKIAEKTVFNSILMSYGFNSILHCFNVKITLKNEDNKLMDENGSITIKILNQQKLEAHARQIVKLLTFKHSGNLEIYTFEKKARIVKWSIDQLLKGDLIYKLAVKEKIKAKFNNLVEVVYSETGHFLICSKNGVLYKYGLETGCIESIKCLDSTWSNVTMLSNNFFAIVNSRSECCMGKIEDFGRRVNKEKSSMSIIAEKVDKTSRNSSEDGNQLK